jgi:phosphoglycerate dehydrogenase-like enzyme
MSAHPRIGVVAPLDASSLALLRTTIPHDALVVTGKDPHDAAAREALAACEVVFGNVPATWLPGLTSLRWLQLESVGTDDYRPVADLLTARGVVVSNLAGVPAEAVAETAVGGLLTLVRGVDRLVTAAGERRWTAPEARASIGLVRGSSAVVLGTGAIGARVTELLRAFGCTVTTWARSSGDVRGPAALADALRGAAVVVSALPTTPGTRGILGRDRLGLLGRDAVLVNVGRGDAVDEAALVETLHAGRLGGAVLDVTAVEPLPASSPLWDCPRTILTQHTGGGHRGELREKAEVFVAGLERWRAGARPERVVDWALGY